MALFYNSKFQFDRVAILFAFLSLLYSCSTDKEVEDFSTTYSISITIEGQGTVSPEAGEFDKNSTIVLQAIAGEGFYFDHWEGFDQEVESEQYEFLLNQDLVLKAIFLPIPETTVEIEVFDPKKIDPTPVFMIENGGNTAYLTSKTGERLQTWYFDLKLGNDIEIMPDGSLIGLFKPETVSFSFGGYGGVLRKISPEGAIEWEYELNTEKELLHHDFEVLPNGNILILVWEGFQSEEAKSLGYDDEGPIYLEKIIELNPESQTIVWQWRSVDHLIQDHDSQALHYGDVTASPEKIDLNYYDNDNGDLMHANGLFYDSANDLIFLSVNFYSEVWVIPHQYDTQTTTTAAGDLRFRFGNPQTYKGADTRLFYNNHHPTLIRLHPDTENRFLIYMNGSLDEQSIVYEFILPSVFDSSPLGWTTPEVSWSFTDSNLFFGKISGAFRLPNGNTLICEGDYGYWEVTRSGEVVWKYKGEKNYWRGYVYP